MYDVAKEHIYEEDEQGVERLVVPAGHPVPPGVDVPKDKVRSADEDPHAKARREAHDRALGSTGVEAPGATSPVSTEPTGDEPLRGQALDDALEQRGLSKSGSVAARRQRVAEHDASQTEAPADSEEDPAAAKQEGGGDDGS